MRAPVVPHAIGPRAITAPMTKPPRLRRGDTIGVVAPGGAVVDQAALDRGVAALEAHGFPVVRGESVRARRGYLAGSEEVRRDDLVRMFADPTVRAIVCARGGYGVTRLLPHLDLAALARHPKILVGYSDASPLLVSLVQQAGLVTFHGPMVAADIGRAWPGAEEGIDAAPGAVGLDGPSQAQFFAVLGGADGFELEVPRVVRKGVAQGTLIGGCLSLLAATVGTPWALRGAGSIVFVEEVAEPMYRIDRMLTQLVQSGALDGARGLVFGTMTGCGDRHIPRSDDRHRMEALLEEIAARFGIPVGAGLPSGHCRPNFTLPFGLPVEIDFDAAPGMLRMREAAVL